MEMAVVCSTENIAVDKEVVIDVWSEFWHFDCNSNRKQDTTTSMKQTPRILDII